jgi:hypothetical protein
VDLSGWLDGLTGKLAAATPGPWTAATAPAEGSDETAAEYLVSALRPDEGRPLWVVWAPAVAGLHDDSDYVVPVVTGDGPASEANARYLADLHAALPELLRLAREGEAVKRAVLELAEEHRRWAVINRDLADCVEGSDVDFHIGMAQAQESSVRRLRSAVSTAEEGR